jgi:hypothetical protein
MAQPSQSAALRGCEPAPNAPFLVKAGIQARQAHLAAFAHGLGPLGLFDPTGVPPFGEEINARRFTTGSLVRPGLLPSQVHQGAD